MMMFLNFICETFPDAKKILCIGDGDCYFANELAKKDYKVYAVDRAYKSCRFKKVQFKQATFNADFNVKRFDLLVGNRPCEATGDILLAAKNNNKSFAVMPCCNVGLYSEEFKKLFKCLSLNNWIQFLKEKFNTSNLNQYLWRKT